MKRHKLVIKFTATHSHNGKALRLQRTYTYKTREACNKRAAEYLITLQRTGFQISNLKREDSEV